MDAATGAANGGTRKLSEMVFIMVVGLWITFNRCIAVRPKKAGKLNGARVSDLAAKSNDVGQLSGP
jgi:hypothetical protein